MKTRLKFTGKKVSFAKTRWRKKKRRQRRRVLFFCLLGLPLILLVIALVAIYLWLRPLLANLPSPNDVVYPGGMTHPTKGALGNLKGPMYPQ